MPELEEKILWWRQHLPTQLQDRPSTVAELEEHIREEIVRLQSQGMPLDAAFAAAMKSLGDPGEIAREFGRAYAGARPRTSLARASLLVTAFVLVVINAFLAWACFRGRLAPLLFVHVATISTGYLLVFGNGLLGLWELIRPLRRSFDLAEQREIRRIMCWLSIGASVFVPIGVALGIAWSTGNLGHAWSWHPVENGALLVLGSSWLLLLAQTRLLVGDRARALLAIIGGVASVVGFAAKALTPVVSVGWLCVALVLIQCTLFSSRGSNVPESAA